LRGKVLGSRLNCESAPQFEAILFSASAQLVSNDLLSCHGGGAAQEAAEEREGVQRESDRDKQNKVQQADSNEAAVRDREL
jgi:hypothetical protein